MQEMKEATHRPYKEQLSHIYDLCVVREHSTKFSFRDTYTCIMDTPVKIYFHTMNNSDTMKHNVKYSLSWKGYVMSGLSS